MRRTSMTVAALLALGGCGVVYTSPVVHNGLPYGASYGTDYHVRVVKLTQETAAAANLEPYVPPRLPPAFRPDAAVKAAELGLHVPKLPPLPGNTAQRVARPEIRHGELPPAAPSGPYHIGIGDVLTLAIRQTVTSVDQLPGLIQAQANRQGYTVQDDGAIAIPDAGRVHVAGLSMQDAEAAVFQALVAANIEPAFSLEISEFKSQQVSVGGLVNKPTVEPITLKPLHLDEAIELAGGLATPNPDTSTIQIFRNGKIYEFPVDRYTSDPKARNIRLVDGDSVFVGNPYRETEAQRYFDEQIKLREETTRSTDYAISIEQLKEARQANDLQRLSDERLAFKDRVELGAVDRPYAYRAGEVAEPGRFALPFERTANLADVLFDKGGIKIQTGDYGQIYVLRRATAPGKFGGVTAYHLNAGNAVNLAVATQFQIHPNDVVFVSEQPITSWNRILSQIVPQIFFQATTLSGA